MLHMLSSGKYEEIFVFFRHFSTCWLTANRCSVSSMSLVLFTWCFLPGEISLDYSGDAKLYLGTICLGSSAMENPGVVIPGMVLSGRVPRPRTTTAVAAGRTGTSSDKPCFKTAFKTPLFSILRGVYLTAKVFILPSQ